MSTLKVNNLQVGQDGTAANNYTLYQPASPDGTVRLGYGVAGSVTDILTLKNSRLGIGTNDPQASLHAHNASGTTLLRTSVNANSTVGFEILKTGSTTQSWRIVDGQTINGALEFYDATNSTTRMIIRDGKVGIGTSNPGQSLSIAGSSVSLGIYNTGNNHGNVYFYKDGTAKGWLKYRGNDDKLVIGNVTDAINVLTDGKIGIGDATPENALTIKNIGSFEGDANSFYLGSNFTGTGQNFSGSGKHAQRFFFNNASSNGYLKYENTGTTGNAGDTITWQERLRITSTGHVSVGAVPATGLGLFSIKPNSSVDAFFKVRPANDFGNDATGSVIDNRNSANNASKDFIIRSKTMRFWMGDSGGEKVRITSDGKVLIGKISGSFALDIERASANTIRISNSGESTHGDVNAKIVAGGTYYQNMAMDASSFKFSTYNGSSVGERLSITSGGNVGINDTAPSEKLNVGGNIMLEGENQFMYLCNQGTGNAGIYVRGYCSGATSNHFLRSHSTNMFTWEVTGSEKMRLHSSGVLTIPNQCGFHIVHDGNGQPNSNSLITNWDTDASHSKSYIKNCSFNGSRFVAPVSGLYFFTAQLLLSGVAANDDGIHLFWTKGSGNSNFTYWNTRHDGSAANGSYGYGTYLPVTGSTTVYLTQNEFFGIGIAYTGDIDIYGTDSNWGHWSGYLVG